MTQAEPVVGRPRETALSVVVPEAEAPTLDFRRRFLERTVARRIPAHVTILYPCAGSVTLLEEQTDGTWSERASVPLGR